MVFRPKDCRIPMMWCGNGKMPKPTNDKFYVRVGTRIECMKMGIGAGIHTERSKNLPENSLQKIKYVGVEYQRKFSREGIQTLTQLQSMARKLSEDKLKTVLNRVFTRAGKSGIDRRGYNSTLMYLYRHGNNKLPQCAIIH
jgi:hypothetical protein